MKEYQVVYEKSFFEILIELKTRGKIPCQQTKNGPYLYCQRLFIDNTYYRTKNVMYPCVGVCTLSILKFTKQ